MELIFYDRAREILGVTPDTLRQAVSRGELTRAGLQGNRQRLIKEQVMLYAGTNPRTGKKKRISYDGLSEQEQVLWHRYASELQTTSNTSIDQEALRRVVAEEASTIASTVKDDIVKALIETLEGLRNPKTRAIA